LGLDNAGKTSIVQSLIGSTQTTVAATRGYRIRDFKYQGKTYTTVDIGGQRSLRTRWGDHFQNVGGIIWVIDSSDRRRMYETGLELAVLLQDDRVARVPILIFANKQDLAGALSAAEIATELELYSIKNRNWQIQDCSALKGTGLDLGMEWLMKQLK
jgi:ADP-ribosylation factor-like protein 3